MQAPSPTLRARGRIVPAFRAWGIAGLAAATAVALGSSARWELSVSLEAGIVAAAVATFLALALATRALLGREALIYYHHEVAVLTIAVLIAAVASAPVLRHLDATALGLGMFLACGRLGCLHAGCCHGRPHRHGISYGGRHVEAGFPAYLAGVRLAPVQLLEAAAAALLVLAGATVAAAPAGAAFGLYVTGYAVVRFGLETQRGDMLRRYWKGLSEAQWTSLVIAVGAAVAAVVGVLPEAGLHVLAATALAAAASLVARRGPRGLFDPRAIAELARTLPEPRPGRPRVATTPSGLQLSAGLVDERPHYTVSRAAGFAPDEARVLARLIVWLRHPGEPAVLVPGAAGAYHVVIER